MTYMGAYIPLNTHPNHISCAVWVRGAKCRGPFFFFFSVHSRRSPKPQKFAKGPKSIGPNGPRQQKYKKKWLTAINQAQTQRGSPAHLTHRLISAKVVPGGSKYFKKEREKCLPREASFFPSSLGTELEALKGGISKTKIMFPKLHDYSEGAGLLH